MIRQIERVFTMDTDLESRCAAADAPLSKGYFGRAADIMAQALETPALTPSAQARCFRVLSLARRQAGRSYEAIAAAQNSVRAQPNDPEAHHAEGTRGEMACLMEMGAGLSWQSMGQRFTVEAVRCFVRGLCVDDGHCGCLFKLTDLVYVLQDQAPTCGGEYAQGAAMVKCWAELGARAGMAGAGC
jgi:hypothetical protein